MKRYSVGVLAALMLWFVVAIAGAQEADDDILTNAPEVGDPEAEIVDYLATLKQRQRDLKLHVREVAATGDLDATEDAKQRSRDAGIEYRAERERLTERKPGAIAGGVILTTAGAASLMTGWVFGLIWLVSGSDSTGLVALGTLAGGIGGIAAGVPTLVYGIKRTPREPETARLLPQRELAQGLTLSWSF